MIAMVQRGCILLVAVLLLDACTVVSDTAPDWPSGLPPREAFLAAWNGDPANAELQPLETYLTWVQRFYQGVNLVPGWLDVSRDVLARVPEAERPEVGRRLQDLGVTIGSEWAKDNRQRRINTRHASVWRDALLEALAQDDLLPFLDRVEADAAALLNGELNGDVVRFERYYIDEFDF